MCCRDPVQPHLLFSRRMRRRPSLTISCRPLPLYLIYLPWPHLYCISSVFPRRIHPFTRLPLWLLGLALYCHGLQCRLPAGPHSLPPPSFLSPIRHPPCLGLLSNHLI
ncbi:hypothetical protein I307_06246 [Cryptococcus deuterogattii 99/473]|uniref:Uncharacterized protein n=1 Tax=Cryptococcus deuterogattii Ram5 TaxID=1296110 RepID=A0A0D0V145_9TREE|nr:hypothetical protein I352_06303 [Cryptococcus deuterogattii MMRL2647]KIR38625.1 hypothetical protein I313_05263 [Cryptococcus deuterogattii Ram5]KIR70810.1 hypothetical protein I310_05222 [Cryptococcus deuterogattii CA1014]KIR97154.1 hypothetical protein L804_05336 [Cryptococcus deuterogattii 2001/935-1]KIY54430.1 hypothetical protein I307_06246 [Cryptococcus deuterogattii 99/473]